MGTRPQTSIEGALYDLVARGKKDTFFQRDDKASLNIFDSRYEQTPAFIPELRKIVPRNSIQWGSSCEFEIEKSGDILIEPTLLIDLPSWLPPSIASLNHNSYISELEQSNIVYDRNNTVTVISGNKIGISSTRYNEYFVYPTPQDIINSVYYNGSVWVAVGTGISYSSDSYNWQNASNGFSTAGYGVTSGSVNGSNLWVAVGDNGGTNLFYSFDGSNWTNSTFSSSVLTSVTYNGSNAWILTTHNTDVFDPPYAPTLIYVSDPTDPTTFIYGQGGFSDIGINTVWNGSMWVSVGNDFTGGGHNIQYSMDGLYWYPASYDMPDYPCTAVAYGQGQWIVLDSIGGVYSSTDGMNFTTITNKIYPGYTSLQYLNDSTWIAANGTNNILISHDNCLSWTLYPQNATINQISLYTEFVADYKLTTKYGYVNGIAYFLFEKIQLYQDNILLQEYSGDALFAKRHLRGSYNSSFLEDALTGVHDGSGESIQHNATLSGSRRLRLRLPFPFCDYDGGLPLCATENQQFRLRLTLRRLEDLVEASGEQSGKPYPWNKEFVMGTVNNTQTFFTTLSRYQMGNPTILLENRQLYINKEDQVALANEDYIVPYSRLYENVFTFGPTDYASLDGGGVAISKRRIDGRHPAEQVYWFFRSKDYMVANRLWKFEASSSQQPTPYYNKINLFIAGKEREQYWSPQVWQDVEAHAKQERYSGRSIGSMNWSYGVQHLHRGPREINPTGTVNFTSADKPTVYVDLASVNVSNTTMNFIVDGYGTYGIRGGRGGLLYAD